jgi:hypothetical protein
MRAAAKLGALVDRVEALDEALKRVTPRDPAEGARTALRRTILQVADDMGARSAAAADDLAARIEAGGPLNDVERDAVEIIDSTTAKATPDYISAAEYVRAYAHLYRLL